MRRWSTTEFSRIFQPSQPWSENLEIAAQIKMCPQVFRNCRDGLVTLPARKLVASIFHCNPKLKFPYSCWELWAWAHTTPLLTTWPVHACFPLYIVKSLDFDRDIALFKAQSWVDFISLPATPKWWLRPDLSMQTYSCLQGRVSLP